MRGWNARSPIVEQVCWKVKRWPTATNASDGWGSGLPCISPVVYGEPPSPESGDQAPWTWDSRPWEYIELSWYKTRGCAPCKSHPLEDAKGIRNPPTTE